VPTSAFYTFENHIRTSAPHFTVDRLIRCAIAYVCETTNEAPEEGRIDEIYRVNASFFLFCTSKMATVKITIQISNYKPIFLSNPKPSFKNGATAVTAHSVRVLI